MHNQLRKNALRKKRALRVRKRTRGSALKPRLSVYRTNNHVSAQLIDDAAGTTIASASTLSRELRDTDCNGKSLVAAKKIGELIAKAAQEEGVTQVVFDRGQFKFHGVVAAVAGGAREAGLKF